MHAHPSGPVAGRGSRPRPVLLVICLVLLGVLVTVVAPRPADARSGSGVIGRSGPAVVTYQPPVDAPVTDPFRPPLTPYGPGNRGIDYATVPGTPVRAAADGLVVFAGPVAGGLHVTLLHRDGVRTTYSFLAAIRVREGQRVRGGILVGIAGDMLHVGARRGDAYIDPASLWGRAVGAPVVHLVPLDGYQRRSTKLIDRGRERRSFPGTVTMTVISRSAGGVRHRSRAPDRHHDRPSGKDRRDCLGRDRASTARRPSLVEAACTSLHSPAGPASAESAITTPAHPRSSLRAIASACGPEDLWNRWERETPPCPRLS